MSYKIDALMDESSVLSWQPQQIGATMNTRPLVCALFLVAPLSTEALPAFPGAGGGGAESVGGRGGGVCQVTNLNDSGPGSFRACATGSGPRTVVFRIGGTINLLSPVGIWHSYLTIAGQTAPRGGITLTNSTGDVFRISGASNVTVRYIRFRKAGIDSDTQVADQASNIIFDHCSMSWTGDENSSVWGPPSGEQPKNITVSWSLIAEPLLSTNPVNIITGQDGGLAENMTDIDYHHNLIANSSHRNPLIKNKTFRFVSNIVYNWSYYATQLGGGVDADIIGNLYKVGPLYGIHQASNSDIPGFRKHEIQVFTTANNTTPPGTPTVYVVGNKGPFNANPDDDNWKMVQDITREGEREKGQLSTQYRRTSPLPALPVPITIHSATELEGVILPTVGASQRLDCMGNWVSNRDAVDTRIINEYNTNKGIIPNTEADVGGLPVLDSGTPCADTDNDGMPDAWEDANGLNKNNPADGRAIHSSGYSNLERYLNGPMVSGPSLASLPPTNLRILN